jgi:hypothetical protein
MISNELLQAYLNTNYQVQELDIKIRIAQIDENLERMLVELNVQEWAFITAYNPRSVLLSDDENSKRHQELKNDVSSLTFFEGQGVGEDPAWKPEKSLLILGLSRQSAKEMGLKYGQNAIVIGEKGMSAELLITLSD